MWDELPEEIREELQDTDFSNRMHGRPSCYKAGCRGPLCSRARRLTDRRRYEEARDRSSKDYKPDTRVRVSEPWEAKAETILAWHWREVMEARLAASA